MSPTCPGWDAAGYIRLVRVLLVLWSPYALGSLSSVAHPYSWCPLGGWTVAQSLVTCPWSVLPLQGPVCLLLCWGGPVSSPWKPLLNMGLSELALVLFSEVCCTDKLLGFLFLTSPADCLNAFVYITKRWWRKICLAFWGNSWQLL